MEMNDDGLKWEPWHYVTIEEVPPKSLDVTVPEEFDYDVIHSGHCGWTVHHGTEVTSWEWHCGFQHEIDNIGITEVMSDCGPGFFAVRCRHYPTTTYKGDVFQEWDCEWDVRPLVQVVDAADSLGC